MTAVMVDKGVTPQKLAQDIGMTEATCLSRIARALEVEVGVRSSPEIISPPQDSIPALEEQGCCGVPASDRLARFPSSLHWCRGTAFPALGTTTRRSLHRSEASPRYRPPTTAPRRGLLVRGGTDGAGSSQDSLLVLKPGPPYGERVRVPGGSGRGAPTGTPPGRHPLEGPEGVPLTAQRTTTLSVRRVATRQ